MTFRTFHSAALSLAVAGTLTLASTTARAQTNSTYPQQQNDHTYNQRQQTDRDRQNDEAQRTRGVNPSTADMSVPDTDAPHTWTQNQILTATVHQAWELSGHNEANFFEIVKELAEISADNRDLVLPNTPTAGRRAGEYIKAQAKADHDQLLYAIVDKSVRMTGRPAPQSASNRDHDNTPSPR